MARLAPGKATPIGIEFQFENLAEVMENLEVEFPPCQFLEILPGATLGSIVLEFADGKGAPAKILGESTGSGN